VADESTIGDPGVRSVRRIDAAAPGRAAGTADRLVADERAAADRQAGGRIENAAAEPLTAAAGLVLSEHAVADGERRGGGIGDGPAATGAARSNDGLVARPAKSGGSQRTAGVQDAPAVDRALHLR